jgi:hypothetical protein
VSSSNGLSQKITNVIKMDIPEYNKRLGGVIKDLQTGAHGQVMVEMALNALTLIKQRVQQKGVDSSGSKYKPYSTKPMLTGRKNFVKTSAFDELLSSRQKRKESQWRTVKGHHLLLLPGGYKQFRQIQDRQTNWVDFTFTGGMWKDINVISKTSDHQRGLAIIGARNEKYKDVLSGNTKRRGDILDLSHQEIEQLKTSYNLGVLKIFRQNGL